MGGLVVAEESGKVEEAEFEASGIQAVGPYLETSSWFMRFIS